MALDNQSIEEGGTLPQYKRVQEAPLGFRWILRCRIPFFL